MVYGEVMLQEKIGLVLLIVLYLTGLMVCFYKRN